MNGCLKCYETLNTPFQETKLRDIIDLRGNNQSLNSSEFKFIESIKYPDKRYGQTVKKKKKFFEIFEILIY